MKSRKRPREQTGDCERQQQEDAPAVKRPKSRRTVFAAEQMITLRDWFAKHEDYPYPQPQEIEKLPRETSLTIEQLSAMQYSTLRYNGISSNYQISHWFTNE